MRYKPRCPPECSVFLSFCSRLVPLALCDCGESMKFTFCRDGAQRCCAPTGTNSISRSHSAWCQGSSCHQSPELRQGPDADTTSPRIPCKYTFAGCLFCSVAITKRDI